MNRICNTCGAVFEPEEADGADTVASSTIFPVCDKCGQTFRDEYMRAYNDGETLDARHIARRMFRAANGRINFILRDIPAGLHEAAKNHAAAQGLTVREYILLAISERTKGKG
jgi:hypothetical protein